MQTKGKLQNAERGEEKQSSPEEKADGVMKLTSDGGGILGKHSKLQQLEGRAQASGFLLKKKLKKDESKNEEVKRGVIFIATLPNHVADCYWLYNNYYSRLLLLLLLKRRVGANSETRNPFEFDAAQPLRHPSTRAHKNTELRRSKTSTSTRIYPGRGANTNLHLYPDLPRQRD